MAFIHNAGPSLIQNKISENYKLYYLSLLFCFLSGKAEATVTESGPKTEEAGGEIFSCGFIYTLYATITSVLTLLSLCFQPPLSEGEMKWPDESVFIFFFFFGCSSQKRLSLCYVAKMPKCFCFQNCTYNRAQHWVSLYFQDTTLST